MYLDDPFDLPLTQLCLDIIVENFSRFSLAFATSKDETMMLLLEFFQRKYSYKIISYLNDEHSKLPEEYLNLLINKHLNILNSNWLKSYSWEKVTSKMADIGCNIQEINLEGDHRWPYFEEEEKPWQELVCYFSNLKVITLSNFRNEQCGLILKSVARFCPNIEEIHFKNFHVTLKIAKNLCRSENGKALCTKLKKLSLSTLHGNFGGLAYFITNFKTLEIIDNPDVPFVLFALHKNNLSLDKVEPYIICKLNFTKYACCNFFPALLKVCLSVCPHLKSIICGFVYELGFFPCFANLEELKLINMGSSEVNVNNLLKSRQENLTSLKIVKCALSVSLLAESFPRVKELILDNVNLLLDEGSKPVFDALSSCIFENINVSLNVKTISSLLSSSSKLESLAFRRCNTFSSEVETLILKCCESYPVKKISFYSSEIRKEFLKDLLLNCTTLKYVNIYCSFGSDDEELLKLAEILPNKPEISRFCDFYTECDKIYSNYDDDDNMYDDGGNDADFKPECSD